MTDFKVGDKVEVIKGGPKGRVGTITEHRGAKATWPWAVEYQKGAYGGTEYGIFNSSELKLVQPEPKFPVGTVVTFCMPDFEGWQGGEGIVRSVPSEDRSYYKVEIVTPPPTNSAQRPGNRVDVLPEWIKAAPKSDTYGLSAKDEAWAQANKKAKPVAPLKIYLAGPMSGIEHYNFPAFFTAARKLRKAGHTVFNPAENDLATGFNALGMEGHEAADHGFSLRDALKTDLSWICENADALVLLDGWEGSKGVRAEMALAEALGLPKYEMAKLPAEVAK